MVSGNQILGVVERLVQQLKKFGIQMEAIVMYVVLVKDMLAQMGMEVGQIVIPSMILFPPVVH